MGFRFTFCLAVLLSFGVSSVSAQWGAPYRNNWIVYGKPYVKVGITQAGIHKLPFSVLPTDFPVNDVSKIQLWHRGKQVAIISTDNKEVVFYAVPNDGASDSLLYRPMSSRINPYWSMYSDEGAYFLTVGDAAGLRAVRSNKDATPQDAPVNIHKGENLVIYKNEYSLSTNSYLRPSFFNSFFEIGASRTGKASMEGKASSVAIQLTNHVSNNADKPVVKLLIHGRSPGAKNIEIRVGKTDQSLRLVHALPNNGFSASQYSFTLESSDLDAQGKGVLNLKAVGTNNVDGYSLTYYSVKYPQKTDMTGKKTSEFNLVKTSDSYTRLNVTNTPASSTVIDITDTDKPVVIEGNASGIMVPRSANRDARLLVTSESVTIQKAKVNAVTFGTKYPLNVNYIILTSENLLDGAKEYAAYRSSVDGGGFTTLVANIKDVYNQFNYGEPSPVAIRNFVDYMISDGKKDKHLFLIGKSITHNERMIRELPDEVPTIGFPASDILLVEGLGGTVRDVPAVPIGRLSAVTNQNIHDYLGKVKEYEHNSTGNYGWRKHVLHLNGGKTASEITQLKQLLAALEPNVSRGIVGGSVKPFVKQQAIGEVETVNITPEVNEGVGLITYFGHGSTTVTDLDMGYITDADRGYNNTGMYPMMYFNGCGVGNIFSARFNPSPGSNDRYPLSMDWLLAAKRGSIAIIANSFESFVSPSSNYLTKLYSSMFSDSSTYNLPIGDIQKALALKILKEDAGTYNVANIHQSVLQGDPALKVVSVGNSDYSVDSDEGIKIYAESPNKTIGESSKVTLNVRVDNLGRYVPGEKLPVEITYFMNGGQTLVKETVSGFAFHDTISVAVNLTNPIEKIAVKLDPANTIKELNKNNNKAELVIDWEVAKNESVYPQGSVKDIVAPILTVRFNDRIIKNDEVVQPGLNIAIDLEDDRLLSADTSRVNVFLKACEDNSCDFKRLAYSSGKLLEIKALTDRSLSVNLLAPPTEPGVYELLVTGSDDAGNTSTTPYRIRFRIDGASEVLKLVVSPNPASSYFRFETTLPASNPVTRIEWMIYDQRGILVHKDHQDNPKPSVNEWYWQPTQSVSGLYYYKVNMIRQQGEEKSITGKVALVR
ncbi:Peptidase family C25 [Dyadobacter soli]|uniref:Peptidase family C25 n=1 Tax=Dyadobacter soli TaxID=659014 RepID=A0A1G7ZXT3_9BACT|nr:C25 family cysteine peptidase [Dyadobacter soli]SDH13421.1 Peptidase family C25 [Dyadobacter soli]